MAVTTFPSDSSVESVKLAVRSVSTCSNATVLSLQGLFRGSAKMALETDSRKMGKNTTRKTTMATGRGKTARRTKAKTSAKDTTALNALEEKDGARLSAHERLVLATEVFNTTLKALSDAVKLSASKRELSSTPTAQPLQPASPNRAGRSPRKSKLSKYTQQLEAPPVDQGLLAVAECARSALSCLRSLKSEQGPQENQMPNMQLEQGACVLAGRYISLGLNDLAYKELRALKRRIQAYLDSVNADPEKAASGNRRKDTQEEETAKERMLDLLTFTNIANARPLLGLLVTFHSNALRLIASDKRPATIQKVCPSLQLSDPSSPASVIMAALDAGSLAKDKAAVQLQLLSNTVLSLASGSQQRDDATSTSKDRLRPVTALHLQLLCLEIRSMGWKLSGHVCDEGREVWDPLARNLSAFSNHSKGMEKFEFALIYKTVIRLQSVVTRTERKSPNSSRDIHSVARIATILGQLAQDAGCLDEALKLFTEALGPLSDGQCLSLATVRCKIASLHFTRSGASSKFTLLDISEAVSHAYAALGLQLKGSANDLDELLVEAAKLKKVAMAWLGEAVTKDRDGGKANEVVDKIREYLQGFLRFLRRYIGRQPAEDSDAKEHERFSKRISLSKSIVLAGIDSAVAMGKLSVMSQSPSWEEMLSILVDCQRLLSTIRCAADSSADECGMGFVKLSNLFWSRYIKEKDSSKDYRTLILLLKQATALLSDCSCSQRITAFAALKCERLAHLYLDGNHTAESDKAFCYSIKEHIDAGALEQVATDATGNYPHLICQDPKDGGFMLGRAISGYLRLKLRTRATGTQDHFDDKHMKPERRGLMLEWQMGLLHELHGHAYSDDLFRSIFNSLTSKLLDIYSLESYPVRRRRVMLSAVRFSLERPSSVDTALIQQIAEEGTNGIDYSHGFGLDYILAPYATHIQNALRLTVGLHQGTLQADDLNGVISSWTNLVRECDDWKSLNSCVFDVDYWIAQLRAVVDYTEIHGLWKIQLSALELVLHITELHESGDFSEAIVVLSRLVLQYCRLGHCKKASNLLARGDQCVRDHEVSSLATLSYKLARVEYLLETGDVERAGGILSAARALYEKHQKPTELNNCSVLSKISWERLVADAVFINSRLSFAQGSITQALFFAKLSVRLNCRIWAKVEKLAQRKQEKTLQASGVSEIDGVVEGVAKLDVAQTTSTPDSSVSYFQGAPFWPHVGSHHTALLNLSSLSAHHGLFQDAIYFGEQALKVNKSLNANVRLVASQTQLGSHWIFGGRVSEGQELLESAAGMSTQLESNIELVSLHMGLASLHRATGNYREEHRALLEADNIMSDLVGSETSDTTPVAELEHKMDRLRIRGGRRTPQQATATRRTRAGSSSARTTVRKASNPRVELTMESKSLLQLRTDLLCQQADCSRELGDFDKAAGLLSDARQYALSRDSRISLHIGESEHLLADAIRHFATHAVYCVLPESTISLPSLATPKKAVDEAPVSAKTSTARKARASTRPRSKTAKTDEDFAVMLSKAGDSLNGVFSTATTIGSTLDSHAASRLMSRISMLTQTTAPGSSSSYNAPANVNEIGRIGAFNREGVAIDLDKKLADVSDPLFWPASLSTAEAENDLWSNFTKEYIDILPDSWNVLSLSLSADSTEFVVSRIHKGQTPFLLRLPLKRGNSDDNEEQFTFEDGREEMQELIKLANESAHAAKAQVDKHMKKAWWKNREALDRRMENLLQNIENVWFGGFRGIFSPFSGEDVAFSRFANMFHNILDKQLPSRQKGGPSATGPRLTLHRNVLQLFTGLKGLEQEEDPEETLMDLLYFVVDILQFRGERNAYDEIDFDMMVVDTLDALRGYHDAVRSEPTEHTNHTVLILDKALHLFPWESLPCLQGSPTCRVPSMECLRDRILRFRDEQGGSRLGIDRSKGTYILNPSCDLQTTQGTFEHDLARLDGWNGIVNRAPTEDEFRNSLEANGLFLYFGHGSGAQYIRGRTIKRLDRCAVAFLMGCSSGTLTEAGEYEPYGTPMNYLHAGSPALVATLWDVTDKDIDRFARATFERWGLIEGGAGDEEKKMDKARARSPHDSSSAPPSPAALDAAVCQSREACVLRYLNGAAPVIYGVPSVFLE